MLPNIRGQLFRFLGIKRHEAFFSPSHSVYGYDIGKDIKGCYYLLGLTEDCEDQEVRDSYLKLAKEYHPDSGSKTADAKKFAQVETAYRTVLKHRQKLPDDKAGSETKGDEIFDIKHTAAQHRLYLSYEGVSFGAPSKREKQYRQYKAQRAAELVYEYKTGKIAGQYETSMVTKDKQRTRNIKTRSSIDRLVEDLVAESMARGDFDNLPGAGKPLEYSNHNPMVDTHTHNINKILINNGYVPEMGIISAREHLMEQRMKLGPEPLSPLRAKMWREHEAHFREKVKELNKKIEKLNMTCPALYMQMVVFSIDKELKRILDTYREKEALGEAPPNTGDSELPQVVYQPISTKDMVSLKDVLGELRALFSGGKKS